MIKVAVLIIPNYFAELEKLWLPLANQYKERPTIEEIQRFEANRNVTLPADVKDYFLRMTNMMSISFALSRSKNSQVLMMS